ncbi:MAG: hypothetical protein M3459_11565 [Actinomycetota bacterium]|nr:hypothetical protein [Actinomycetota bacterium]
MPDVIEGEDRRPDPNRIDLPEGVDLLGRPVAPPRKPTPNEIFGDVPKPSLAERVREAVRQ